MDGWYGVAPVAHLGFGAMAALDSLPGDQRAVLQLVLGRGRSYDEIARLLSIDPDAVRERAHPRSGAEWPSSSRTAGMSWAGSWPSR
jgi:hypothetical protein